MKNKNKNVIIGVIVIMAILAFSFEADAVKTIIILHKKVAGFGFGSYNQTLANNVLIDSNGYQLNFINGTNNPVQMVQTSTGVNITISDTTGAGGGITSINSQTGYNQTLQGTLNRITVSSSANTHTFDIGSAVITTASSLADLATRLLSQLQDVVISSPQSGHILRYGGANWANTYLSFTDISGSVNSTQHGIFTTSDLHTNYQLRSEKDQANGYAGLNGTSKLSASQLPAPTASTLGGVKTFTCSDTNKSSALDTTGAFTCTADEEPTTMTCSTGTKVNRYDASTNTLSCAITYDTVLDEGTARTQRANLNFIGAGVSCADNADTSTTDCTIAGGGGGASITRISGSSGAAGADITWQILTSDSATCTTTTLCTAAVMTTTGVGTGTWHFKYTVLYQSAATTTGIGFGVAHTGTVTKFRGAWYQGTTGTAAATGVGDNVSSATTGQIYESSEGATLNAIIGANQAGVAVANTDVLATIEGIIVVSVSGDMQLKISSEVSGSAVKITTSSMLELHKIA